MKTGFTAEFYKHFFDLIGFDLIQSLNQAFEEGELSISQRRGVITLIPKEDSDLLDIQNWRPITLLNIDYKIASKALAKRIESVLPKLVHSDQTGFMKGRYIGENIRLINDVMEYTMSEKKGGILVSLDFEKAFDTLEWQFIMKVLDLFNFGENVKRWIRIFYTNIESTVLNNGFTTNWIKPTRGVRQGWPLSPYLFILSAEILSNKLRQTTEINGINLFGNEVKISQFADDTNLFCTDIISVENSLNIVNNFGVISGLKLNVKKTKAIWLGKWSKNKTTPLQLQWVNKPVKILGLYFSYDDNKNKHFNFDLKVKKLQTKLDLWKARNLTLFGKALIIKSLGLSQIVYAASNLNTPTEVQFTIKSKLFSFLWNKKKDKIKRESIYQDYDRGGIRMTDIDLMIKGLRLAWISRLLNPERRNWKSVPNYFFTKLGGLNFFLRCNYDAKYLDPKLPIFYKDILSFFSELKSKYNYQQGQETILFNNKAILIGGKPFFLREWFSKGIISIQNLLNENGQLISFQQFQRKYDCKTNFLKFYQVINAIPKTLLTRARNFGKLPKESYLGDQSKFQLEENIEIDLEKAKAKDFYWLLNNKVNHSFPTGPTKWSKNLNLNSTDWGHFFKLTKRICKENKLKEFHYKFLHRIIVTKKELHRFGIKDDGDCLYCGNEDSIEHTFIHCQFSKAFQRRVIQWFNSVNNSNHHPSVKETLFGLSPASSLENKTLIRKLNYTLLYMRYYIYTNKLHNRPITLSDYVNKLNTKYKIEKID